MGENEVASAYIKVDGVSKVYAGRSVVRALDGVSLEVQRGSFVSVVGPSGCGKSTLLMLVAGLLTKSGGAVEVGGREVERPLSDVGIVFQSPVLLDWRSALGNVLIQAEARGIPRQDALTRATDLLNATGLRGFEDSYPFQLSGGMQQRVAICRALLHDPPLLLMDEPFGALDALTRDQLTMDLLRIWQAGGPTGAHKTVLFITHSVPEAVFLSDFVIIMTPRPGKVERVLAIDLPRPRAIGVRESPEFGHYVSEIFEMFMARGVIRDLP